MFGCFVLVLDFPFVSEGRSRELAGIGSLRFLRSFAAIQFVNQLGYFGSFPTPRVGIFSVRAILFAW
jgi:hypothetical protein